MDHLVYVLKPKLESSISFCGHHFKHQCEVHQRFNETEEYSILKRKHEVSKVHPDLGKMLVIGQHVS